MRDVDLLVFTFVIVLAFVYLIWFTIREFNFMSKNKFKEGNLKEESK
jgi:Na+/H+ antiporter NhaC